MWCLKIQRCTFLVITGISLSEFPNAQQALNLENEEYITAELPDLLAKLCKVPPEILIQASCSLHFRYLGPLSVLAEADGSFSPQHWTGGGWAVSLSGVQV